MNIITAELKSFSTPGTVSLNLPPHFTFSTGKYVTNKHMPVVPHGTSELKDNSNDISLEGKKKKKNKTQKTNPKLTMTKNKKIL